MRFKIGSTISVRRNARRIESHDSMMESTCKHERLNRILLVDCSDCSGVQDLRDMKCLSQVVNVLSNAGPLDEIVLQRGTCILYTSDCTEILIEMARLVRFCREASRHATIGPKCKKCALNPRTILNSVEKSVLSLSSCLNQDFHVSENRSNPTCLACIVRMKSVVKQGENDLDVILKMIGKAAFHVVGEGR
ncbi:MAG: hypothetical protein LUO84_05865 [Methanomassiliicoccales archaeon]|nr:hypothetical protein [Methanomassiliicoccales archaeon]